MNDLISVIIPVYNGENYIRKAIDSVLNQTYKNFEIIVVNDGSKDKTSQIVSDYIKNNQQIKLINQENKGVSSARNEGIVSSSGDYIAFLDSDDEFDATFLEKTLDSIKKAESDICVAHFFKQCPSSTKYNQKDGVRLCIEDNPLIFACHGKLYKASSLKANNIYFPKGVQAHEDSFFVFNCFVNGLTMVHLNERLYKYNTENTLSLSRCDFSESKFAIIELAKKKYQVINDRFPEFRDISANILIKAYIALLLNLASTKKYKAKEKESISFLCHNKAKFIPSSEFDKKFFYICTHHLYWLYKMRIAIKKLKRSVSDNSPI